jgi:hypothetical protein
MNQFVYRLHQIFMRFRQHHLFLKASKCHFGYTEIEYVGKVISENGLKMSQEKIRSLLDFPIPSVSKQFKSLLRLTNYFRNFVKESFGYSKAPIYVTMRYIMSCFTN